MCRPGFYSADISASAADILHGLSQLSLGANFQIPPSCLVVSVFSFAFGMNYIYLYCSLWFVFKCNYYFSPSVLWEYLLDKHLKCKIRCFLLDQNLPILYIYSLLDFCLCSLPGYKGYVLSCLSELEVVTAGELDWFQNSVFSSLFLGVDACSPVLMEQPVLLLVIILSWVLELNRMQSLLTLLCRLSLSE